MHRSFRDRPTWAGGRDGNGDYPVAPEGTISSISSVPSNGMIANEQDRRRRARNRNVEATTATRANVHPTAVQQRSSTLADTALDPTSGLRAGRANHQETYSSAAVAAARQQLQLQTQYPALLNSVAGRSARSLGTAGSPPTLQRPSLHLPVNPNSPSSLASSVVHQPSGGGDTTAIEAWRSRIIHEGNPAPVLSGVLAHAGGGVQHDLYQAGMAVSVLPATGLVSTREYAELVAAAAPLLALPFHSRSDVMGRGGFPCSFTCTNAPGVPGSSTGSPSRRDHNQTQDLARYSKNLLQGPASQSSSNTGVLVDNEQPSQMGTESTRARQLDAVPALTNSSPVWGDALKVSDSETSLKISQLSTTTPSMPVAGVTHKEMNVANGRTTESGPGDRSLGAPESCTSQPQEHRTTKSKRSFPEALMSALMEHATDESVVEWLPDDRSFVVLSPDRFEMTVLRPAFHKETKYPSFIRKMHRWGFVRSTLGTGVDCYHHPHFRRNRMDLASKITCLPRKARRRRRHQATKSEAHTTTSCTSPSKESTSTGSSGGDI